MNRVYYIDGAYGKITLHLGKDCEGERQYDGCIVILFYKGKLLMAYHPKRKGWEFPGGKREPDETIEECAKREVYEETGATVEKLILLGRYAVISREGEIISAIYYSEAESLHPLPSHSEMEKVDLFSDLPDNLSFKDDVYKITMKYMEKEELLKKE